MDTLKDRPTGRPVRFQVGVADEVTKMIAYRLLEPALRLSPPVQIVCRDGAPERLLTELATHALDLVHRRHANLAVDQGQGVQPRLGETTSPCSVLPSSRRHAGRISTVARRRAVPAADRRQDAAPHARSLVRPAGDPAAHRRRSGRQRVADHLRPGRRGLVRGADGDRERSDAPVRRRAGRPAATRCANATSRSRSNAGSSTRRWWPFPKPPTKCWRSETSDPDGPVHRAGLAGGTKLGSGPCRARCPALDWAHDSLADLSRGTGRGRARRPRRRGTGRAAGTSSHLDRSLSRSSRCRTGCNVILHRDTSVPVVAVNLWYHVGSANERAGRTGFAHLFEHVMFEGSKHVPEGSFDTWLEAAGANNNGSTSNDRTNYYIDLPANALELALFLESDRMGFLLDDKAPEQGRRPARRRQERAAAERRQPALRPGVRRAVVAAVSAGPSVQLAGDRLDGRSHRRQLRRRARVLPHVLRARTTPAW